MSALGCAPHVDLYVFIAFIVEIVWASMYSEVHSKSESFWSTET